MKSGIIVSDKTDWDQFVTDLMMLPRTDVLVGITDDHSDRDAELGDPDVTNAMIGIINEYGAPEVNIPARPHLMPGIRDAKDKIVKYLGAAGKAATEGRHDTMLKNLHAAGLVAQASVRSKIQTGPFEALAAATLYRRKHRKVAPREGENPLQDTGQYRNSITYVVRER